MGQKTMTGFVFIIEVYIGCLLDSLFFSESECSMVNWLRIMVGEQEHKIT